MFATIPSMDESKVSDFSLADALLTCVAWFFSLLWRAVLYVDTIHGNNPNGYLPQKN